MQGRSTFVARGSRVRRRARRGRLLLLPCAAVWLACSEAPERSPVGGRPDAAAGDEAAAGDTSDRVVAEPPLANPAPPAGERLIELAPVGRGIFASRGCAECHTIGGGDRTGPDLAGVTERRSYPWIARLLLYPEYMVQTDPDAQRLLIEHFHAMPNLELSEEEARAVYAYLVVEGRRTGR